VLIHPWDAASDEEWRAWLREGRDFGQLVVPGTDWPVVVPTHFAVDADGRILIHLARPNPVWRLLEDDARVVLTVVDDYAYIPTSWRAAQVAPTQGVPTSYYAALQLRCRAELVDDPAAKAALLTTQLAHFQPEGHYAPPAVDGPHERLLPGIRGLRLTVVEALAKFKFDDHKPSEFREAVNARLRERGTGRDLGAAAQQRRRLARGKGQVDR
jgi:transcriptional regulator